MGDLDVELQDGKLVLQHKSNKLLEKIIPVDFCDSEMKAKFYKKRRTLAVSLIKT